MALVLKDRVQETTTTTGTSDFVLGGAVLAYQSFSVIGNTNTTFYTAFDSVTGAWEVGIGTYSTTGPTLARTTILDSSASGAKVSFAAGTKNVFATYPAERAVWVDGTTVTYANSGVAPINVTATTASQTNYVVGVTATGTNTTPYASTSVSYNSSTNVMSAATFSASSDETLKTNWRDLPSDFLGLLANVRHGIFDRLDDGQTRVGVGAQSLQKFLSDAVIPLENGQLTVDYGPAALVACVKLAQRVLELERIIKEKN